MPGSDNADAEVFVFRIHSSNESNCELELGGYPTEGVVGGVGVGAGMLLLLSEQMRHALHVFGLAHGPLIQASDPRCCTQPGQAHESPQPQRIWRSEGEKAVFVFGCEFECPHEAWLGLSLAIGGMK